VGLFSSKKKITVGTVVSRVVDNELLPNSIKTGALKGILADGNIADYAMEELVTSIAMRADRMYSYAESGYIYGSPSGEFNSSIQGRNAVAAVLAVIAGESVSVDYSHYGPPNNLHIGWLKLVELHGYVPATNQLGNLSTEKGVPVYLKNLTVVVPEALMDSYEEGALDQWGYPASSGYMGDQNTIDTATRELKLHTPVGRSSIATEVEALVEYQWTAAGITQTAILVVPLTGYNNDAEYFHARYSYGGNSYYWMYEIGEGTYPTLDSIFAGDAPANGSFFPFAYFRFGKQAMNADTGSQAYLSSKKLMKYIGLDFDTVTEGINENPDIADVEQAMMIMAVPAVTTNPTEQLYLFDFFSALFYGSTEQYSSRSLAKTYESLNQTQGIAKTAIVIKDSRFKMAVNSDGIYRKVVVGNLGKVGTCTSGVETEYTTVETSFWGGRESSEYTSTQQVPSVYHYYRKQVSKVSYEEIRVLNMQTVYHIYGSYTSIGDDQDAILLIPIDRSITKNYTLNVREELYSRSLHYVFNSVVIQKIKWYQTGIFQIITLIVSVVIAIYTLDPEVLMWAIAVQSGTMTVLAFIFALASAYLVPYLLTTVAVKYFVKAVGNEIAFLAAIVAAAYGIYQAYAVKSLAGAPWAKELLSLANGLTSSITDAIRDTITGLKEEADAFGLKVTEEYKLIEDASSKLLSDTNRLSSFVIFGEKPADYFARTIHSGNIGIKSIEAVTSYVQIALTLPKLSDSLGEIHA